MTKRSQIQDPPRSERGITIRRLSEADAAAIRELAGRDSQPVPVGELVGLEVEGRLVAMQSLTENGEVIADPFARTAELRALLKLRVAQLRARGQRQAPRPRAKRSPGHAMHPLALFRAAS